MTAQPTGDCPTSDYLVTVTANVRGIISVNVWVRPVTSTGPGLLVHSIPIGLPHKYLDHADDVLFGLGFARASVWERDPAKLVDSRARCQPVPESMDAELDALLGRQSSRDERTEA